MRKRKGAEQLLAATVFFLLALPRGECSPIMSAATRLLARLCLLCSLSLSATNSPVRLLEQEKNKLRGVQTRKVRVEGGGAEKLKL